MEFMRVTDFDELFRSRGLTPLPDDELKEAMSGILAHIQESDLADYLVDVKHFNSRPVHVTESLPGEYLINMGVERVVHWWHVRRDFAVIPKFMTAAQESGLTYEESVSLLRAVAHTNRYDFGDVHGIIEATADVMEIATNRGTPFKETLSAFKAFLVEARKDGEVDRAFGIMRLGVVAGMTVEQSLDIVQSIYDGYGIAGYVFRDLYDELDALGANNAGGDLVYKAVKAVHSSGLGFTDMTSLIYAAATQTAASQEEVFGKLIGALAEPETEATQIAGAKAMLPARSADPFKDAAKAMLPKSVSGAETVKGAEEYFPEIGLQKLAHGLLPYRMQRSLEDGLADLHGLMKSSGVEGSWVFDPDSETWFSLGGRTKLSVGRARHEFIPYDVSALSERPIHVHVHPKDNEVFIAPSRDSLAFPQMQKKLVSFLTAMPSGSDFGMITELARTSSRPVEMTGLIVTSLGVTEFRAPAEAEAMEEFVESFKFAKGEAMSEFDAAGYLARHGIAEPDFMFVEKMLPAVRERLPEGFEIAISRYEDFEFGNSFARSSRAVTPTARLV